MRPSNSRITELEITTKGTLGPSDKKKVIGSVSPAGYKWFMGMKFTACLSPLCSLSVPLSSISPFSGYQGNHNSRSSKQNSFHCLVSESQWLVACLSGNLDPRNCQLHLTVSLKWHLILTPFSHSSITLDGQLCFVHFHVCPFISKCSCKLCIAGWGRLWCTCTIPCMVSISICFSFFKFLILFWSMVD